MLTERNGDLGDYLTHDPSGQKLPGYLTKLSQYLVEENTQLLSEVDLLARNIEHIKEVVAVQQSYAKVSGVFENLQAEQLVEDSIAMNIGAFERHGVILERKFSPSPAGASGPAPSAANSDQSPPQRQVRARRRAAPRQADHGLDRARGREKRARSREG